MDLQCVASNGFTSRKNLQSRFYCRNNLEYLSVEISGICVRLFYFLLMQTGPKPSNSNFMHWGYYLETGLVLAKKAFSL